MGMRLLRKIIFDAPEKDTYNFQSKVKLNLKFWGYNEQKCGFLFDTKSYFRLTTGDAIAMGHPSLIAFNKQKRILVY